jgi:hypothetical protein
MMEVKQVKTPDDIERYIEGCLNDFESAISTKDETVVYLAELAVHIYEEAKKEQGNIPDVSVSTCIKCGSKLSSVPHPSKLCYGCSCLQQAER